MKPKKVTYVQYLTYVKLLEAAGTSGLSFRAYIRLLYQGMKYNRPTIPSGLHALYDKLNLTSIQRFKELRELENLAGREFSAQ